MLLPGSRTLGQVGAVPMKTSSFTWFPKNPWFHQVSCCHDMTGQNMGIFSSFLAQKWAPHGAQKLPKSRDLAPAPAAPARTHGDMFSWGVLVPVVCQSTQTNMWTELLCTWDSTTVDGCVSIHMCIYIYICINPPAFGGFHRVFCLQIASLVAGLT